ncbi:MAG: tRNA preQ1(34) S-adenosylmethionine ribosyltransferase-isomerase QueA [Deltaproteobacteria bacterium]|nr:tRNA preQ1(34) S-adenosylmethionine ribosyltransferase-isomerase QueA [Candidatus Deferrimicrobiaceae bacterium]
MKTGELDYPLPPELIAQSPAGKRRDSRLMAVCRRTGEIRHLRFPGISGLLRRGDLLVLNDTRVIRGRLRARKATGAAVEVLLLSPRGAPEPGGETWEALARPSKRLREGMSFRVGERLGVTLLRRLGEGRWTVRLSAPGSVPEALESAGEVPLPPYIRRKAGDPLLSMDAERYQTVYARRPGSVAAPTAGLHFEKDLLEEIASAGVLTAMVTLSIGYGTFSTIRSGEVEDHRIHAEPYRLESEAAAAVADARKRGGRVVAVGTTSLRTLETCAGPDGRVAPSSGMTRLFITPGYRFRAVDALLTNFHLPRSSLLALVMAFGGTCLVREAYRQAVAERYRFFSYGDAMFLY